MMIILLIPSAPRFRLERYGVLLLTSAPPRERPFLVIRSPSLSASRFQVYLLQPVPAGGVNSTAIPSPSGLLTVRVSRSGGLEPVFIKKERDS